jgi:hypothetical protein
MPLGFLVTSGPFEGLALGDVVRSMTSLWVFVAEVVKLYILSGGMI